MTEGDGDTDALRVPPWLTGGESTGQHAAPEPPEPELEPEPAPPEPVYVERHAPPVSDDVASHGRRRWVLAGVTALLLLLPTVLVMSLEGKNWVGRHPAGVAPSFNDVSLPGPGPDVSASPTTRGPSPSPSPTGTVAAPPPVMQGTTQPGVTFGPVTIEAEAPGNAFGGSASEDQYPGASGGVIIRNLGNWDDRRGPGFLRFQNVVVPVRGTYTLKFFFMNINDERTRTAVITVAGTDPQSVTVEGSSTCCAVGTARVTLREGQNTIAFGNSTGHAPSIDRIVLSLP